MKERLEKVIEKIILPQFPGIVKYDIVVADVTTQKIGIFGSTIEQVIKRYSVFYYYDDMERFINDRFTVENETESLFKMLGPSENEKIRVDTKFNV